MHGIKFCNIKRYRERATWGAETHAEARLQVERHKLCHRINKMSYPTVYGLTRLMPLQTMEPGTGEYASNEIVECNHEKM